MSDNKLVKGVAVHEVAGHIDEKKFRELVGEKRQPFVLRGVDLGACVEKWTPQYIAENSPQDVAVAHVSPTPQMNFIEKNFAYKKMQFGELVERASGSKELPKILDGFDQEHYYFRSLGEDVRKDPSNFHKQFPELEDDLRIPPVFSEEQKFSSVFRMSSPGVQLWTHYDVMDNILIEVRGRKRVVLFPPNQALDLYLKGDKSLVTEIDDTDLSVYPKFANVERYECELSPGDILFIPALWFHNVIALDFCVAVNVFWRNLPAKLYDPKDVYGNKDLNPALRAQDCVARAAKLLDALPSEYKDFYARKLIQGIKDKCSITD